MFPPYVEYKAISELCAGVDLAKPIAPLPKIYSLIELRKLMDQVARVTGEDVGASAVDDRFRERHTLLCDIEHSKQVIERQQYLIAEAEARLQKLEAMAKYDDLLGKIHKENVRAGKIEQEQRKRKAREINDRIAMMADTEEGVIDLTTGALVVPRVKKVSKKAIAAPPP